MSLAKWLQDPLLTPNNSLLYCTTACSAVEYLAQSLNFTEFALISVGILHWGIDGSFHNAKAINGYQEFFDLGEKVYKLDTRRLQIIRPGAWCRSSVKKPNNQIILSVEGLEQNVGNYNNTLTLIHFCGTKLLSVGMLPLASVPPTADLNSVLFLSFFYSYVKICRQQCLQSQTCADILSVICPLWEISLTTCNCSN